MILAIPMFGIVKIVLENIEETRPIAIMLSERAPTLEEAWQDALKDGNLSSGEYHKLSKLQKSLGVSDEEVARISATALSMNSTSSGRAFPRFKMVCAADLAERPDFSDLGEMISKGKATKSVKSRLEDLIQILEEESEEE